jgi:hypothetical protein
MRSIKRGASLYIDINVQAAKYSRMEHPSTFTMVLTGIVLVVTDSIQNPY